MDPTPFHQEQRFPERSPVSIPCQYKTVTPTRALFSIYSLGSPMDSISGTSTEAKFLLPELIKSSQENPNMDVKYLVEHVEATRKNTCKVPTEPYSFLTQGKRSIFKVDNSFNSHVYQKYKERIWEPVNEKNTVIPRVTRRLSQAVKSSDLEYLLEVLDSCMEDTLTALGDSNTLSVFSFIAAEYRKQCKAQIYQKLEMRYLREKLQKLLISVGNNKVVASIRNESNSLYTQIRIERAAIKEMNMSSQMDDIKALRLISKLYDEKLENVEGEELTAMKARGRWHFILDFLEARVGEEREQISLQKLLNGMNRNPEQYRCFFIGIKQMDYDQLGEDEELIKLKTKIDSMLFQVKTDKLSIATLNLQAEAYSDKLKNLGEEIEEMKVLLDTLDYRIEKTKEELAC